ncbi:SymE family type I addiction module toxin [Flavobacterium sp. HSC-61S13]|uniref:SymE family type I addiction module toxin n=1 Tax=Flavobacterium sp. HSC-61S13 TaxID=2910963 RepID=UPI0020A09237|nr:SymE family type I addiction module toxin [Flavobacterium sp. HSC-61S13]MCP1996077.1 toxic protein SymE [Flavobacterium sp. HSC-61S13]
MRQEKNTEIEKIRLIKVYSKYVYRIKSWPPVFFPEIRLCGKWLQELGFKPGQTIKIIHKKSKITITIEKQSEN